MTTTISRPAIRPSAPEEGAPAGPDSRAAELFSAPNEPAPREINSQSAVTPAEPVSFPLAGPDSRAAVAPPATASLTPRETSSHATDTSSETDTRSSRGSSSTARQASADTQSTLAIGRQPGGDPAATLPTEPGAPSLLDPALSLAADFLDDVERVKIANENRLRALTRVDTDKDGIDRYVGLEADHPVVAQLAAMVGSLAEVEHAAVLNLQRMLRKHPLGTWVKGQKGIGEKQGARLLAVIGDPYWRPELVREDGTVIPAGPRTVSALWAYCGLHVLPGDHRTCDDQLTRVAGDQAGAGGDLGRVDDGTQVLHAGVAARRRKGQQANWSTKAKTRAYLIAESCLKQLKAPCHAADFEGKWLAVHYDDCGCSPYRLVYDRRKSHTSVTRPEWTDGHRHADALRVASKEILKDLWRAARDWHLAQGEAR